MLTLPRIASLFASHGTAYYGGEAISQTAHALQCAQVTHYMDMAARCLRAV
ncbi:hypothetical protein LMG23994_06600 [Cupriavidus pinatubonensis]|uniref:Uncharacterized protein n=1 Tax=Cupriavidus pinatubonensis TaxID=248026 RepID=A0ABM8Y313_9BURK|nr:hypothetical protein LMG23994_06600 [Cupriavidus pinatubonensis]